MQGFNVDKRKTLNAALYVLNRLGEVDYHKTFKILYFADKEHVKNFGRPVTGDAYQAMNFGPVPSFLYDIFKAAEKGSHPFAEAMDMSSAFAVRRDEKNVPIVTSKIEADMDELAQTDIEALDASIEANKALNFDELVDKSHDSAWTEAANNVDIEMSYFKMAQDAGASEEMIGYIVLNAENDQTLY